MSSTPNDETTFADLYKAYDADDLNSSPYPLKPGKGLDHPPVFDSEGDLWIDVGGGDDGEPANRKGVYRFRVISETLGCASHVLEALIVGPWRKQKPAATDDEKWVVALPDDHPVAMAALLAMMHHKVMPRVPRYPAWAGNRREVMWRILSAAEKYDVTHLLWVHEIEWPEQAIYILFILRYALGRAGRSAI
ncbi:hypothetical protein F5144DRAFT_577277 [Chaetomium tenue]|uniref:Uncharacterized protein n=1 Tax=Chaetomium tenue TaxID=1854479 RepID=A0ACB7P407_9PEZI|nr:hypothetical protein F5144DRAFT_577277 [Chaetomium globosum]